MSGIFQIILSAISGAVIGSLCFGLWLAGLMFLYVSLYGYYNLGGFIFGVLDKPVYLSFITGLIFGSIQGFLVGLFASVYETNNLFRGVLVGFIVSETIIFGIYFLLSVFDHPNPVDLIFGFIQDDLFRLIKISLVLFVPSAITGAILARVVFLITSK